MTDRPDHSDEPRRPDPAAPAPPVHEVTGTGRLGAAGSTPATPSLAAGSRHYRDLIIARRLRKARASLGAFVHPSNASTVTTPEQGGPDGVEGGRSAAVTPLGSGSWPRRRLTWTVPEVRVAAVLLAFLLTGVVATALPDDMARAPALLPDRPTLDLGIQAPATTAVEGITTTAPGEETGPVNGGQLPMATGSTGQFGSPGGSDTPVRPPTTGAQPPQPTAPLPGPLPAPVTSPPTTAPRPTPTTSPVTTTGPTKPTRRGHPPTTKRKPPKNAATTPA